MELFVKKHFNKKKLSYYLMLGAIGCSRKLANLNLLFSKIATRSARSTGKRSIPSQLLIVAGQAVFNDMIQMVKYAIKSMVIAGRIAVDDKDCDASTGKLGNIAGIIQKNAIDQVLFCEGEMSNREIIMQMQQLKGKVNFLFHSKSSSSIVGSSSRDANGIFYCQRLMFE